MRTNRALMFRVILAFALLCTSSWAEDGGGSSRIGNGGFAYESGDRLLNLAVRKIETSLDRMSHPTFVEHPERKQTILDAIHNIHREPEGPIRRNPEGEVLMYGYGTDAQGKGFLLVTSLFYQNYMWLPENPEAIHPETVDIVMQRLLHEASHLWGFNEAQAREFVQQISIEPNESNTISNLPPCPESMFMIHENDRTGWTGHPDPFKSIFLCRQPSLIGKPDALSATFSIATFTYDPDDSMLHLKTQAVRLSRFGNSEHFVGVAASAVLITTQKGGEAAQSCHTRLRLDFEFSDARRKMGTLTVSPDPNSSPSQPDTPECASMIDAIPQNPVVYRTPDSQPNLKPVELRIHPYPFNPNGH